MEKSNDFNPQSCSTFEMTKYSLGACTESLVLNSFFGFSMLYYTKALGLGPEMAGWATAVVTLWDAVSDPIMGHISDNTRSRFGKRMPYMFVGGLLMLISFFFIWYVPSFFKTDLLVGSTAISGMTMLFGYLVAMNLLLRTAYTVFVVPYTALGFEICTDYNGRSKIQGIRMALNMAANLLGPAMAWFIFFPNNKGALKDTQIAQNYIDMGTVFTIAGAVFLLLMLFFMLKHMKDSRQDTTCHGDIGAFFKSIKDIVLDKYPRWVFIFMIFVGLGWTIVSTLQMYVFDDFMQLNGLQKTIAHGGTMVGFGLGSISLAIFVRKFDKKGAVYASVFLSVSCELLLAALFLTGFMEPDLTLNQKTIAAGTVIQGVITTTEQPIEDTAIPVGTVITEVETTKKQKIGNITIPKGTVIENIQAMAEQKIEGFAIPIETAITSVQTTADLLVGGIPIAFIIFSFLHGAYWFGVGVLLPVAISMIADVSEIHKIKYGVNKDASYAAMFSLAQKLSGAIAGLVAGYCLLWSGFQSGADAIQTPESIWRVCALTFVAGPLAQLVALVLLIRYPVDRAFIEKMRAEAT